MTNKRKVALITGAAQRIGKSIALELHNRNIDVVLHCGQSINAAKQLCTLLNDKRSNSAAIVQADLLQESSSTNKFLVQQSIKHFNRLDYLINNAAIFYPSSFLESSIDSLEKFLQVNTFQAANLIREASCYLKRNNGAVVNIIDIYAKRGLKEHCDYSTSKNALLALTQCFASVYAPEIRINAVSPGAILWPSNANNQNQQTIIENTALKRQGSAQDISKTVAYLLIDALYTTGSEISVDGGRQLYI